MARPKPDEHALIEVARLRYENGVPQNEIARTLRLSEATVSRYLNTPAVDRYGRRRAVA